MESKKKFKIATLGCRTNQYESQAYANQLLKLGYEEAGEGEKADLCIVNTCTVTESADSHSRSAIRELARQHEGGKLVVTGCLAERLPAEVGAIQGVSRVVSNRDKERLLNEILQEEELPEFAITHFQAHTRAFVKVQDGCNSYCTYCIIPYVRGRSRSRNVDSILSEVRGLIANGYKEVVLTGINIGDFDGGDPKHPVRLAELVRAVDQMKGLERLRLSSIDPDEVDEDLANAILQGRSTCHSMHIVLQAGSNLVLKKMNRKYTRQIFLQTVERLKQLSPRFTFTTDVIVGFPGESEEDFQETLGVMEQVHFAKVHMFPYSERTRTRAALFSGKVAPAEIRRRKQLVLQKAEEHSFALRERYVGQRAKVLIEGDGGEGHTDNFLPVIVKRKGLKAHDLVEVDLISNHPEGLYAH